MRFAIVECVSVPGGDPNEDAFAAEPGGAVVLDGATPLSEPLMPGKSDAAWLAGFGVRRLMSHLKAGDSPRGALRHTLADAERSFAGLRRRAPTERYELPCASMMLAVPNDEGFDALWYGDCSALVLRPGGDSEVVGIAMLARVSESQNAARLMAEKNLAPVEALQRDDILPYFRDSRAKVNTPGGTWLFSPVAAASEHVAHLKLSAPAGTLLLLASDGFLALTSDYGCYDAAGLVAAARDKGLKALAEELREIEEGDPEGRQFPRFKKSDDATAILLKLV